MRKGDITKAYDYFKKYGFIKTAVRISRRLELFVYRKAIMYHKQLKFSNHNLRDDLNIIHAREENIREDYEDHMYKLEQAISRLKKDHLLFIARKNNTNVFYGWVEFSDIEIPWLGMKKLHIPSEIGYVSGFYVPSDYRGQHISTSVLEFIENYLIEKTEVQTTFAVTSPKNLISKKLLTSNGYRPYQHVKYIKILGFKLYAVGSSENKNSKKRKVFVHTHKFWDYFSQVLRSHK